MDRDKILEKLKEDSIELFCKVKTCVSVNIKVDHFNSLCE